MDDIPPPKRLNWKALYRRGIHVDHRLPTAPDSTFALDTNVGDNFFHELVDWNSSGILVGTSSCTVHLRRTVDLKLELVQKISTPNPFRARSPKMCNVNANQFAVSCWSDTNGSAVCLLQSI